MEVSATLRHAPPLPRRRQGLVADQLRGLPVERAIEILSFARPRAASTLKKVLESGDCERRAQRGRRRGRTSRRHRPLSTRGRPFADFGARARGRAGRITKRTSHITVTVTDERR